MPDAVEPVGQDMDQEAANELGRGQLRNKRVKLLFYLD